MHIKKGDNATVIAGAHKGKTAAVLQVFPKTNMVLLEGLNMKKKHVKPTRNAKGSTIEKAHPLHASNVKRSGEAAPKKAPAKKKATKAK